MKLCLVVIAAIILFFPIFCPAFEISYSITDIGTLGGDYSAGRAINDAGVIVGDFTAPSLHHAFYYDGEMHDMGTLGGVRSIAMGINDSGNIIGASTPYNSDYDHAFFYDGEMHDLGTLNRQISVALGINNNNKVVGELYDINLQIMRAFYYDGSFMTDIGTLGGNQAYASDINNSDHIVGESSLFDNTVAHAFYYDGTMHDIGTMYGGESVATAINDSDVIIGFELAKNGYYSFYFDGTMHDIGSFGSDNYTVARAINNKGKIVGVSEYASGIEHAFLYDETMLDLNNLIPMGSGWEILEAWGINDRDQIAAYGWKDGEGHALLLSPTDMKPIPEPSTIFLLGAGLAGIGLLRRKNVIRMRRKSSNILNGEESL